MKKTNVMAKIQNTGNNSLAEFTQLVESHAGLSKILKTELGAKIAFEVLEEAFDFKINNPSDYDWDISMMLIDDPICKLKKAQKSTKQTNNSNQ